MLVLHHSLLEMQTKLFPHKQHCSNAGKSSPRIIFSVMNVPHCYFWFAYYCSEAKNFCFCHLGLENRHDCNTNTALLTQPEGLFPVISLSSKY